MLRIQFREPIAPRFHLTPSMAEALYRRIVLMGAGDEISHLDNRRSPDKIRRTLALLNIPHTNLSFNELNGYSVNLSPESEQLIRDIQAGGAPLLTGGMGSNGEALAATQLTVECVLAFRGPQQPLAANANRVQLNCPDTILHEFRQLLAGSPILGRSFVNPYTGATETLPAHAGDLTARHLQLLARNERVNTTGVMNVGLYGGMLTHDQIARLRCLVKATNVAGVVNTVATGGYHSQQVALNPPQRTIVIDQAGLQWQGDFQNTGGMFFYPNNPHAPQLPPGYAAWQATMYHAMYGQARPAAPSANIMTVRWLGVTGLIDLDQLTMAIDTEFSQAFDAAVAQGDVGLTADERINFKFLKAGMGFFADGLVERNQAQLEHARLRGIEQALRRIAALPEPLRRTTLGKVGRIELPFSAHGFNVLPPELNTSIQRIQAVVTDLGVQWGGTPTEDALTPKVGFVTATTNCGDPHAMIGNEGGHSSVDASISTNCQLDHLNPGFNPNMQLRTSPACTALLVAQPAAAIIPVVASAAPPPAALNQVARTLGQFGFHAHAREGAVPTPIVNNVHGENLLKQLILQGSEGKQIGQWEAVVPESQIEVGIGRTSGLPAIASRAFHLQLEDQTLVILDKQHQYARITDPAQQTHILNEMLLAIPATQWFKVHLKAQVLRLLEASNPAQGTWGRLENICAIAQISITADTPLRTWEFGRSGHTGNLCFANTLVQVEFQPNGEIAIQDKRRGYGTIAVSDLRYSEVLRQLSNCFPEFQEALQTAEAANATADRPRQV